MIESKRERGVVNSVVKLLICAKLEDDFLLPSLNCSQAPLSLKVLLSLNCSLVFNFKKRFFQIMRKL